MERDGALLALASLRADTHATDAQTILGRRWTIYRAFRGFFDVMCGRSYDLGLLMRGIQARLFLTVSVSFASACAHQPVAEVQVAELQRTVASLRAQNAAYTKQVEELENRVFILTDQVDSHRVATPPSVGPRLPMVKLHPGDAETLPSALPPDGALSDATVTGGDDTEVEYVGEAARTSTRRPLLRLVGPEQGVSGPDVAGSVLPGTGEHSQTTLTMRAETTSDLKNSRALDSYRASLDALQAGRHADAAAGFRAFVREHPTHDYADNAQYWLAECYYDLKDFVTAAHEFRRVVDVYPQGNKVPDALLKLGYSYLRLNQVDLGRAALVELQRAYPKHEAAGRAAARLAELNGEAAFKAPTSPMVAGATGPAAVDVGADGKHKEAR